MDLESGKYADAAREADPEAHAALAIVTPSTKLASALKEFLSSWGFAVKETIGDVTDPARRTVAAKSTTLLLDYRFSHQLLRQVKDRLPVLITGNRDLDDAEKLALLYAGASGYLRLPHELHLLVKAVNVVSDGGLWFERSVLASAVRGAREERARAKDAESSNAGSAAHVSSVLTPRENLVATYAAQGLRNREIALQLHIAEKTVKLYMTRIYRKMGVSNRIQLGLLARHDERAR